MDDGARDADEARLMLDRLAGQGVDKICLSPHYLYYKWPLQAFLVSYEKKLGKIVGHAEKRGITLIDSAEVYLTGDLLNIEGIEKLCVRGTNLMLSEFPGDDRIGYRIGIIEKLIINRDIKPVIAHIDRSRAIMRDGGLLDQLLDMGCLTQVNLPSLDEGFLGSGFIKKRAVLRLFEKGKVHFIGTDCHGMRFRPPEYLKYADLLDRHFGDGFFKGFNERAEGFIGPDSRT